MMTERFKKAIDVIIKTHEGGFQNRKDDPGNYREGKLVGTKYGISARSFPASDIPNLTIEQAEEIYYSHWGRFELLRNEQVLIKVLDLAVNMQFGGHGPATKILQGAIVENGGSCEVDGAFGPNTAAEANKLDTIGYSGHLLDSICTLAQDHYKKIVKANPDMKPWFNNWEHRAVWLPENV
jgi:lysozyme family protein